MLLADVDEVGLRLGEPRLGRAHAGGAGPDLLAHVGEGGLRGGDRGGKALRVDHEEGIVRPHGLVVLDELTSTMVPEMLGATPITGACTVASEL